MPAEAQGEGRERRGARTLGSDPEDVIADAAGRVAEIAGLATALARSALYRVADLVDDVVEDSGDVAREAEALYESARGRLEEAREVVRAAPRLTRVVAEALGIAARYRLHAALHGDARGPADPAWEPVHRRAARRARRLCEEQRGGLLKLGQFASTRVDLLPPAWTRELARLQDRVEPLPTARVTARLDRELGPDWGDRFESFEAAPLAAASLAQVHGATLADGTRVAVKLLVPGIEDDVEADLAALDVLAPTLCDWLPRVDLDTVLNELRRSVRCELDLHAEAQAAREMREAFASDPDVIVPRCYPEASTRGVLVLERIDGERLPDFLEGCAARGDVGARERDRVFALLLRSYCQQVLVHGLFQGDAHPGNFLVVPGPEGPRLALVDFGCVERYDATLRRGYAALATAILAGDETRMVEGFRTLGFRSRSGELEALRAYAERLLEVFRAGADLAGLADPRERVARILELTEADPIVAVPGHFVLLGRVFASLGGLLAQHRPRLDLAQILRPELAAALRTS